MAVSYSIGIFNHFLHTKHAKINHTIDVSNYHFIINIVNIFCPEQIACVIDFDEKEQSIIFEKELVCVLILTYEMRIRENKQSSF